MFSRSDNPTNPRLGTTTPTFIPRAAGTAFVQPGDYFWIKVHSAQAAFHGSIFEQVKQLVITSKVNLNHPVLGNEDIHAIQRTRAIKKGAAEQLGLSSNLISLVPAAMTHVSVAIEFILDKENNLAKMGSLINSDAFLSAVSLAPGAAAVAKTIGGLAQKVIQTFIPAEQQQPILQFTGDFDLGASAGGTGLRDGFYAILGSRDERNPLPTSLPALSVTDDGLLFEGQPLTQLSYVVLDVARVPVRTRALSEGAAWDRKLREAETMAQELADDPFASDTDRRDVWGKCKTLLQEARTLLLTDPNFAAQEAEDICKTLYKRCADIITGTDVATGSTKSLRVVVDTPTDRAQLNIPATIDLDAAAAVYTQQVKKATRLLKAGGLL